MNTRGFKNGDFVKASVAYGGSKNSRTGVEKSGIVEKCFPYFALVQFNKFKQCFFYNELSRVTQSEYKKSHNQKVDFVYCTD
jgi:hypothetical protein